MPTPVTRARYVMARCDGKCQRRQPGCLDTANKGPELVLDTAFLQRMTRDVDYADNWCGTCTNCTHNTV